jgi:hypothetical protein
MCCPALPTLAATSCYQKSSCISKLNGRYLPFLIKICYADASVTLSLWLWHRACGLNRNGLALLRQHGAVPALVFRLIQSFICAVH